MDAALTRGPHHIGLTVAHLEASAHFFTALLGWKEVRRVDDYPAIFVSDGHVLVTLWGVTAPPAVGFDRHRNNGLHHLAFAVADEATLATIYQRLRDAGIEIEFPPEALGGGAARHMMCHEPSGVRIEFIWPGPPAA